MKEKMRMRHAIICEVQLLPYNAELDTQLSQIVPKLLGILYLHLVLLA